MKEGQDVILAIHLKRSAFDSILSQAVVSKYLPNIYATPQEWNRALKTSHVRLQWDPDHSPSGGKLQRRAIQLGLRGYAVVQYSQEWILKITDISVFVAEQRHHMISRNYEALVTPSEEVYEVNNLETATRLNL